LRFKKKATTLTLINIKPEIGTKLTHSLRSIKQGALRNELTVSNNLTLSNAIDGNQEQITIFFS
jgi:hypothetical protein